MKRNVSIICISFWFLLFGTAANADELKLESEADRISYSLGQQIGRDFKRQGVDLDAAALVRGFNDANKGAEPALDRKEMNTTLGNLKGRINAAQREEAQQRRAQRQKEAEENRRKGQEFLADNESKPGVKTLPSGLQYKVLASGKGKSPGMDDQVTVNYVGTLIDGTEFDSSAKNGKPATFPLKGLIKGWSEALQLMHEGDTWQLFVPANLAYGKQGPLANQALIFEIELLKVSAP